MGRFGAPRSNGCLVRYFLDCEFNGWHGSLISMALVSENDDSLYLVWGDIPETIDPWVEKNVLPLVASIPEYVTAVPVLHGTTQAAEVIADFLKGDPMPFIVTDWPDDIRYFCETVIVEPGKMAAIPGLVFQMVRFDAYPTDVEGAVQHNAYWDAVALRALFPKRKA